MLKGIDPIRNAEALDVSGPWVAVTT